MLPGQRKKMRRKKGKTGRILCILLFLLLPAVQVRAGNTSVDPDVQEQLQAYREYQERFRAIEQTEDVEAKGFRILTDQVFSVTLESFGEEPLTFLPALDTAWQRLAVFLADDHGRIRYRSDQLETNYLAKGELLQLTRDIASVSFADVNRDGKKDIILITRCENTSGDYAGIPYKVGDVLFQGEESFYRDFRISDKINRFSMNQSTESILSYVRDGRSAEFLYTATTLEELLENGFTVIEEQCYTRTFEKLGRLQVVPGTFRLAYYDVFLIYLVNEQGDIVWSLQPMEDYDSLYSLKGVSGRDLDGDGLKDLVVLARYSREDPSGSQQVESSCSIYYQRTGGFETDTGFKKTYQCSDEDTMEQLVQKIREYWGWQTET